jgi:hypothetical protein
VIYNKEINKIGRTYSLEVGNRQMAYTLEEEKAEE